MTDDLLGAALVASDHALGNALEAITTAELAELLGGIEQIKGLRTSLATVSAELEHRAGVLMDADSQTVGGVEWVRSKPAPSFRKSEDGDERLLHDLTDAVNKESGEIEPLIEKVKKVYPLAASSARKGGLEPYGLDKEDYCVAVSSEDKRWRVMKAMDKKGRKK